MAIPTHPDVSPRSGAVYYVRAELDINTAPEYGHDFRNEDLGAIFGELVELGIEISQKGDVR